MIIYPHNTNMQEYWNTH